MAPARRKTPGFLPLFAFLLAATAPAALAKYQNNFDLYPAAAQPCLYAASDASLCDGDTVASMNKCLCSDARGGFVTSAALCIGRDADPTLRTVYQSMSTACSDSKTPIALTEDQFLALGARGATASSLPVTPSATTTPPASSSAARHTAFKTTTTGGATVTVTSAPTSSSTSAPDPESSGLSTAAKIGVGVGAGVGVAALLGLAAFVWRLKRSRDAHDESHRPMLGGGEYKGEYKQPGWRPVSEIAQSTSPVPGGGAQTWATNSPQPPYAQPQQQHAWGHHPQAAYVPPPYQPHPQQQQQQQQGPQQGGVFELASIPAASIPAASPPQASQSHPPDAVEMPAAEVQPRPERYIYPSQRQ
ncbi:uncharacterized protein LY79DRAFT_528996 [Colletotrichum navitas]|uniref:Extracellular membrane protein CFEM domain-containing protein n=1 Tax=Colletotrichum navitas TaxID=681940 RepID=A0AAD8UXJ0_9PEZI|nr:uncharacterized protein LY79DRAFT_528996 [Colletotrichum navitas]KAK1566343.1 hypothetical protein LY79DRAFT_528996 [Colletotrichum navitas]